jgi:hypothetical protein
MILTDKQLKEKARKALPKIEYATFLALVDSGVRTFHNGGTRRRTIKGVGLYIAYSSGRGMTTAIIASDFLAWCKGYVRDGIMYDNNGIELKGASEDGIRN